MENGVRTTPPFPAQTVRCVYRLMGIGAGPERIGAGLMDKSGWLRDHENYRAVCWSLSYVIQGRGNYTDQHGKLHAITAGDCFLRIPGIAHTTRVDADSGWHELFIDIGPNLYASLARMQILRDTPAVWSLGIERVRILRWLALIDDIERAAPDDLPALAARVIALATEAQRTLHASDADERSDALLQAVAAIDTDPLQRRGMRALAKRVGMPYDRFRRAFTERYGIPPGQYAIRRRLDRACSLLLTTSRSVRTIAEQLGYPSPFEFSAQFTKHFGVSPTRYRER